MSLIERAAERLEALKRAGVSVPPEAASPAAPATETRAAAQAGSALNARARTPAVAAPPIEPFLAAAASPAAVAADSSPPPPPGRYEELNLARLAAAGFVTPDAPRSGIADEFRVLKRPLIANASRKGAGMGQNSNLIMVTSAVPGEGKSFCAINLALSMAMEMDRTVLLVDADVARPSIPQKLGISSTGGLLDVLLDKSIDLGQVLIRTSIEKFNILTAGTQQSRSSELLASDVMRALLMEMANRYSDRIIIFDSPPLLVTTEARVLAGLMGQIVFVVEAESTPQSDVQRALQAIEACPIKMLVLNQARSAAQGAYGYGRGYGYGYGN